MGRYQLLLALVAAIVVGCGDNSNRCGPHTSDTGGVCVGDNTICGDGTVLDDTGECVPSPDVCGDGTVLINGECRDPAAGIDIDLDEGPEPNGFEPDKTPAGVITLKPAGEAFVIHGCIKPLDNVTADLDDYLLSVNGPTLIRITADGVEGLAAGFMALGDQQVPLVRDWLRLGINLSTDTSKRQLFLPAAGTYDIVLADTRSLYPITEGIFDLPPAGNPADGTTCYYVSITTEAIPAPTPLNLVAGDAGTIGEDLKFYSGPFPTGFVALSAVIDPETTANPNSHAASSLVVLDNNDLRQVNEAGAPGNPEDTPISTALFGGINPGDSTLLVLDYVWNYAIAPVDYKITVQAALTSDLLSTTGSAVPATGGSHGRFFIDQTTQDAHFENVNLFHWDVISPLNTNGFDLASSIPLDGGIFDQNGNLVSDLSGDLFTGDATASTTFTTYRGLIRTATPGRYYFFVYAPRTAPATTFTVTSTITNELPSTIVLGTPSPSRVFNAFKSNIVKYDATTTEPWQLLDGTGVNTGNVLVHFYDPATAFGRLDTIARDSGGGPVGAPSDVVFLHNFSFAPNGSTPIGHIFLDPNSVTPPVTDFLVKVNPTLQTGTSFTFDFEPRDYHDFATLAAGSITTVDSATAGEPLDTTHQTRKYLLHTAPGNTVTITMTPITATLDPVIDILRTDETASTTINAHPVNQAETTLITQNASGFIAFQLRSSVNVVVPSQFTLTVKVDP